MNGLVTQPLGGEGNGEGTNKEYYSIELRLKGDG